MMNGEKDTLASIFAYVYSTRALGRDLRIFVHVHSTRALGRECKCQLGHWYAKNAFLLGGRHLELQLAGIHFAPKR
jgi:hypothetical protein